MPAVAVIGTAGQAVADYLSRVLRLDACKTKIPPTAFILHTVGGLVINIRNR